jgi:hypothetical protein
MPNVIEVHHRGKLAAVVTAERAIIDPTVTGRDLKTVQAMCLHALDHPDTYTDAQAIAYADHAAGIRVL